AAKLMGRWRSGAPLVLAPQQDDPELVADRQRNNNFNYGQMDPQGLACPIGAHLRRVNPRDTINNLSRRRLIRLGLPYGPLLPEGTPDDGMDRGIAIFFGCASLSRQFEFVQKDWINAPKFQGLDQDKDPIVGDHDGTYNMTIQKRPIKKTLRGLPRFTTVKGGAYFFLPGLQALRLLANG
ncbi:MAG: peroxidase, partial [Chloroflexi bacterium]|nr:peroxidase [Chloroflexota bacterium]